MSTKHKTLPKFAFGSRVRVKKGVTTPNHCDMPLGGWCGNVYQTSGTICLVHWSEATLEAVHSIHRERRQRDGVDCRAVWLQERSLEADSGEPLCIDQTKKKIQCVR
jgi:hypothetical protein